MPCQILTSGLKAKATPAGALALSATPAGALYQNANPSGSISENGRPAGGMAENARPQDSGWCQVYQFAVAAQLIVTFDDLQMVTFSGDDLETFSSI